MPYKFHLTPTGRPAVEWVALPGQPPVSLWAFHVLSWLGKWPLATGLLLLWTLFSLGVLVGWCHAQWGLS